MSEFKAVGVRIEDKFLSEIEALGREEHLDRSSTIRVLLLEGYKNYMKRKAAEAYMRGEVTISRAAKKAGVTIWEMQQHLLSIGFVSRYDITDLEEEVKLLAKKT